MPRYLFEAVYDGTNYEGWQSQPHGNTIQDYIEHRLDKLMRRQVRIYGAGRTDTGVHAQSQPFHVDLDSQTDPQNIAYRLNRMLPADIAIRSGRLVSDTFHARFDAVYREYCYRITTVKDPLRHRYCYYVHYPLNMENIEKGLKLMRGRRDFKHFCMYDKERDSSICDITKAEMKMTGDHNLEIRFGADRFMRKMIRYLIGSLLFLSRNKMSYEKLQQLLECTSETENPASIAPAHGLTLEKVEYPEKAF